MLLIHTKENFNGKDYSVSLPIYYNVILCRISIITQIYYNNIYENSSSFDLF